MSRYRPDCLNLIADEQTPEQMAQLAQKRMRSKIPQLVEALTGRVRPHHRFMLQQLLYQLDALNQRIEPKDLSNWMYLRKLAAAINWRLLETECVSQDCLLSAESFERVSEPTVAPSGERSTGLRFGQPRAMALFAALARIAPALNGFRHRNLRPVVQSLLQCDAYTSSQMTYDLRRLRLKGLIARIQGTHRYIITSYGRRVAALMTKLHSRIFNLASTALIPEQEPSPALSRAFSQIDAEIDRFVSNAQLSYAKT